MGEIIIESLDVIKAKELLLANKDEAREKALVESLALAEKIYYDILNGTNTRYEPEDDSDIYTIREEGESK